MFGVIESRKTILNDFDRVWEGVKFKETIHDIHSFTPYRQIGDLHIGSNTMDMLDTNKKNPDFTRQDYLNAGYSEQEINELFYGEGQK